MLYIYLGMSNALCSSVLYKPIGYVECFVFLYVVQTAGVCGVYFVFLYVVHTSYEC